MAKCPRGWSTPGASCCQHKMGDHGKDPKHFLVGTEVFSPWGMNSGVMYMNVKSMHAEWPKMLECDARAERAPFSLFSLGFSRSV